MKISETGLRARLLFSTGLVASALLAAPAAHAAPLTVSGPQNTTETLSAGDALTITPTGVIYDVFDGVVVPANISAASIDNQGAIDASLTNGYVTVLGISLVNHGTLTAGIANSGSILAANTQGGPGFGIQAANHSAITGGLVNSGTISGVSGAMRATNGYGVNVSINSTLDSLTNQVGGLIKGQGNAVSESSTQGIAYGYGVYVDSNSAITGLLSNAGTITGAATATAATSNAIANGAGVYVGSGSSLGALTNLSTGIISATANTDEGGTGASANAYGIHLDGGAITGTLTNNGTISGVAAGIVASTNAANAVHAAGIYLGSGGTAAAISNNASGVISASATSSSGANAPNVTAQAYGIHLNDGTITGALYNAGHITATDMTTTTAPILADADGIFWKPPARPTA